METIRVAITTAVLDFARGTVFELEAPGEQAGPPPYYVELPDDGHGQPTRIDVVDTSLVPDHALDGVDGRRGPCRITRALTYKKKEGDGAIKLPPCGRLLPEHVVFEPLPAQQRQRLIIALPPFEHVASSMVLYDRLRDERVMEYELRNYSYRHTELTWDIGDLRPGFYELHVVFPDGWRHVVRFIKFYPVTVDPAAVPPPPKKPAQLLGERILAGFPFRGPSATDILSNEALALCLEWGEHFNQPIHDRLQARHPGLTREELDAYDRLARTVRSFVYGLCEREARGELHESELLGETMREYPWVSAENFARMKNIGMYYARR
jgi:hypothetical protein